jgi:CheY-like chemotaxis protein
LASRREYALVVMDMLMPGMSGIEAAKAIRQLQCNASVPIIAMTANAFPDDRRRCREAGMNDFIAKPVRPTVLFSTILKWLAHTGEPMTSSGRPGN